MSAIAHVADLPHNQNQLMYTVPAGKVATVTVNLCNRTTETRAVGILIVNGAHTNADFLEHHCPVPPRGVLERTGIVMLAEDALFCVSNTGTGVSARVHGFEEEA